MVKHTQTIRRFCWASTTLENVPRVGLTLADDHNKLEFIFFPLYQNNKKSNQVSSSLKISTTLCLC